MINYSTWKRKKISTTSLRLDINNPRLSETNTLNQNEIIEYLINYEKVYELSVDIATKGYFLNEGPIVIKENGKYHVLEGNRRVSACKILLNPDLVKSTNRRRNLINIIKNFDLLTIQKLDVIVAPTREEADIMIVNRHTGGSSVEKWDKTKQDRFLYIRFEAGESITDMSSKFPMTKSEIKDSLKRHIVYKELCDLRLDDNIKAEILDESKFSMTNLERAYQSNSGLKFMGFEFDENKFTLIKKLPKEEFEKRINRIASDVVKGEINSRKLNTESDKKMYFDKLSNSGEFNTSIELDKKYNNEYPIEENPKSKEENPKTTPTSKPQNSRRSTVCIMPRSHYLDTGISRIDDIFNELKSLNLKKHPNAVSVLFRSYLDMLSYQFLKKFNGLESIKKENILKLKGENDKKFNKIKKDLLKLEIDISNLEDNKLRKAVCINDSIERSTLIPPLKFMLSHMADSSINLIDDNRLKQALQGYIRNNTKLLGHNDFNLLVHNEYYTSDPKELQLVWTQMHPLLEYLVQQIKS